MRHRRSARETESICISFHYFRKAPEQTEVDVTISDSWRNTCSCGAGRRRRRNGRGEALALSDMFGARLRRCALPARRQPGWRTPPGGRHMTSAKGASSIVADTKLGFSEPAKQGCVDSEPKVGSAQNVRGACHWDPWWPGQAAVGQSNINLGSTSSTFAAAGH